MTKYRKKSVDIDAWYFRYNYKDALPVWITDRDEGEVNIEVDKFGNVIWVDIKTLEGVMTAVPGDWIIKGVKGELYPCKPDIFDMTYEEVK